MIIALRHACIILLTVTLPVFYFHIEVSQGPSCRQDLIKAKATEFECDVKCAGVIKIVSKFCFLFSSSEKKCLAVVQGMFLDIAASTASSIVLKSAPLS